MSTIAPSGGWKILNSAIPAKVLLGFEYEIDNDEDEYNAPFDEETLALACPHYIWEFECLGCRDGWEIKSHVAPLHMHRPMIERFLGIADFNTCSNGHRNEGGIHINVSRNTFTERSHNKVFSFLHDPKNYDALFKMSKRSKDRWQNFCQQQPSSFYNQYYGIITSRKVFAFELRMFAAHPNLLIPAMEVADSLFRLAPQLDSDLTFDAWEQFTRNNPRYKGAHKLIHDTLGR
jgi:hypothetical protein